MSNIKIYGERNCGTNYLYSLLEKNTESHIMGGTVPSYIGSASESLKDLYFKFFKYQSLGWKHGFPAKKSLLERYSRNKNLLVITISKSPYAFLTSSYKRPYGMVNHKAPDFLKFLQSNCAFNGKDNCLEKRNITPIELWNLKNKEYLRLNEYNINCVNLCYENLIANPQVLQQTLEGFSFIKCRTVFENIKSGTKTDVSVSFENYQEKYLKPKWEEQMNQECLDLINSKVDVKLMDALGYKVYTS